MKNQYVKERSRSIYKPVLNDEADFGTYFGIIGFDKNGTVKCSVNNLTDDYKFAELIADLLNANGVDFVHAEDVINDMLYENAPSFTENILHKAYS